MPHHANPGEPGKRRRCAICQAPDNTIQPPSVPPITVSQPPLRVVALASPLGAPPQVAHALANSSAKAPGTSTARNAPQRATCQGTTVPGTMASSSGTMSGTNTRSKYGGPTDNLPKFSASMMSGYKVPNNTAAMATTNSTLLSNKNDSREPATGCEACPHCCARQANKDNETPTTTAKNNKINRPRPGSVAKACTEVNTPERTKNVPSKLSEKAPMAKSTVQALNCPRLSVTMSE